MFWWLKKLLKNPTGIGSVAPSAPSLARLMTKDIQPPDKILELGPGDGAITTFILEKLDSPSQLTLIESDPDLCDICRTKFPDVMVHHGDVEDFLSSVQAPASWDVILSGIPFAAMEKTKRNRVFKQIHGYLKPGGAFIMFQYSPATLNEVRDIFGGAKVEFTPLNVPPAFVFICRKR